MKKRSNLKTIGAVFAALSLLGGSNMKALSPSSAAPSQQEDTNKQVALPQETRKKYSKREIDPGGPTRDGIFFPGFHEPFFNPTRSQRIKNKRTGHKRYFQTKKVK